MYNGFMGLVELFGFFGEVEWCLVVVRVLLFGVVLGFFET